VGAELADYGPASHTGTQELRDIDSAFQPNFLTDELWKQLVVRGLSLVLLVAGTHQCPTDWEKRVSIQPADKLIWCLDISWTRSLHD